MLSNNERIIAERSVEVETDLDSSLIAFSLFEPDFDPHKASEVLKSKQDAAKRKIVTAQFLREAIERDSQTSRSTGTNQYSIEKNTVKENAEKLETILEEEKRKYLNWANIVSDHYTTIEDAEKQENFKKDHAQFVFAINKKYSEIKGIIDEKKKITTIDPKINRSFIEAVKGDLYVEWPALTKAFTLSHGIKTNPSDLRWKESHIYLTVGQFWCLKEILVLKYCVILKDYFENFIQVFCQTNPKEKEDYTWNTVIKPWWNEESEKAVKQRIKDSASLTNATEMAKLRLDCLNQYSGKPANPGMLATIKVKLRECLDRINNKSLSKLQEWKREVAAVTLPEPALLSLRNDALQPARDLKKDMEEKIDYDIKVLDNRYQREKIQIQSLTFRPNEGKINASLLESLFKDAMAIEGMFQGTATSNMYWFNGNIANLKAQKGKSEENTHQYRKQVIDSLNSID